MVCRNFCLFPTPIAEPLSRVAKFHMHDDDRIVLYCQFSGFHLNWKIANFGVMTYYFVKKSSLHHSRVLNIGLFFSQIFLVYIFPIILAL